MSVFQDDPSPDDFLSWWDTLSDDQQGEAMDRLRQEASLLSGGTRLLSAAHAFFDILPRVKTKFSLN